MDIFHQHQDLSEKLNCSWGNKGDLYLLEEDLSNNANLSKAMRKFPILKKLVKKYKYSLQEIERCRKECNEFLFSEGEEIWQLKEFFRHWFMYL